MYGGDVAAVCQQQLQTGRRDASEWAFILFTSDHAEQIFNLCLSQFLWFWYGDMRGHIPKSSQSDLRSRITRLL